MRFYYILRYVEYVIFVSMRKEAKPTKILKDLRNNEVPILVFNKIRFLDNSKYYYRSLDAFCYEHA